MATSVTHHDILYPSRAQYVVIYLSPQLQLGIINIYGFSHPGPKAMLWNHLANTELPEAKWIIADDFNNIENPIDKQGGSAKTCISAQELEAWSNLLTKLGVSDAFHMGAFSRKTKKTFAWSNARNDNTIIQSRIDRIYVPPHVENIGGTTEILPTLKDILDHAGVISHFNDEGKKKSSPTSFNQGLVTQPESKTTLLATWKGVMNDPNLGSWNQRMVTANQAIREKSAESTKNQRKKWKETYQAQFEDIIQAEEEL